MSPPREPTIPIMIRLPESVYHELRVLIIDPRLGNRPQYGSLQHTITRAVREWLERQKVSQ